MSLKQFNVNFADTRDSKSILFDELCGVPKPWIDSSPLACRQRLVTWCGEDVECRRDGVLRGQDASDIERIAKWRGKKGQLFKALTHPKMKILERVVGGWKIRNWEIDQPHLVNGDVYVSRASAGGKALKAKREQARAEINESASSTALSSASSTASRHAKSSASSVLDECSIPTSVSNTEVGNNPPTDNPFGNILNEVKQSRHATLPGIPVARERPVVGGLVLSKKQSSNTDPADRIWAALATVLCQLGMSESDARGIVVGRQQLCLRNTEPGKPKPADCLYPIANMLEATERPPDKKPVASVVEYVKKCTGTPAKIHLDRADGLMKKALADIDREIRRSEKTA